jgi:hypothetical protein
LTTEETGKQIQAQIGITTKILTILTLLLTRTHPSMEESIDRMIETETINRSHTTTITMEDHEIMTTIGHEIMTTRDLIPQTTTGGHKIMTTAETDLWIETDTLTIIKDQPIQTGNHMKKISETTDHHQETETDITTPETTRI